MSRTITGTSGNDYFQTSADVDRLQGMKGDDVLDLTQYGGGAWGGAGNDTIFGGGYGRSQSHIYAGDGDDVIYLNTSDRHAPYGEHVWGQNGNDQFRFINVAEGSERITGRIEDFDIERDEIWVDDEKIDLRNPPDHVRLVSFQGQPWLLIDERIFYALEGARKVTLPDLARAHLPADDDLAREMLEDSGFWPEDPDAPIRGPDNDEELHFLDWPTAWENGVPTSATMTYDDLVAFFPASQIDPSVGPLNQIAGGANADELFGGRGNDHLTGLDHHDLLDGRAGDDVLDGAEGHDVLYGGLGNDSLSGGLDNDLLFGGAGNDVLYGGSGQDTLYGDDGDDKLFGNTGRDLLRGGAGNDLLVGGSDSDYLDGGEGDDTLYGGLYEGHSHDGARDTLVGGDGNDHLYAADAEGRTDMTGGEGDDHFYGSLQNQVTIHDFSPGQDVLHLSVPMEQGEEITDFMEIRDRADGTPPDLFLSLPMGASVLLTGMGNVPVEQLLASMVIERLDPAEVDHSCCEPADGGDDHEHSLPWKDESEQDDTSGDDEDDDETPQNAADASGGACFVATACYGDRLHPDVMWLRRLRDERLVNYAAGRAFVRFYWKVGPIMARFVRSDRRSGVAFRGMLQRFVKYAQSRVVLPPK